MREAIGGTWLLGIVVLFIVLFSAFLALSVNYTKAFKVKNKIVNIIEENEGFSSNNTGGVTTKPGSELEESSRTEDKIYAYLTEMGYATTRIDSKRCTDDDMEYVDGGYCIKRVCNDQGAYYKVRTFIKVELPIIYQTFTFPINGETKLIYTDTGC